MKIEMSGNSIKQQQSSIVDNPQLSVDLFLGQLEQSQAKLSNTQNNAHKNPDEVSSNDNVKQLILLMKEQTQTLGLDVFLDTLLQYDESLDEDSNLSRFAKYCCDREISLLRIIWTYFPEYALKVDDHHSIIREISEVYKENASSPEEGTNLLWNKKGLEEEPKTEFDVVYMSTFARQRNTQQSNKHTEDFPLNIFNARDLEVPVNIGKRYGSILKNEPYSLGINTLLDWACFKNIGKDSISKLLSNASKTQAAPEFFVTALIYTKEAATLESISTMLLEKYRVSVHKEGGIAELKTANKLLIQHLNNLKAIPSHSDNDKINFDNKNKEVYHFFKTLLQAASYDPDAQQRIIESFKSIEARDTNENVYNFSYSPSLFSLSLDTIILLEKLRNNLIIAEDIPSGSKKSILYKIIFRTAKFYQTIKFNSSSPKQKDISQQKSVPTTMFAIKPTKSSLFNRLNKGVKPTAPATPTMPLKKPKAILPNSSQHLGM